MYVHVKVWAETTRGGVRIEPSARFAAVGGVVYPVSMVDVTVSLPDDVAARAAAAAADRGVTVERLASEALQAYLDREQASNGTELSFIGLGDAEIGFSAREAEEMLEAEGRGPSRSS